MGTSKERFISARGIAVSFLIILLIIQMFMGASAFVFAESKGNVNADNGLYIRSGAGTENKVVALLPYNAEVTILGETKSSDGITWYQISSKYGNGYVCATYITVNQAGSETPQSGGSSYSSDMDFDKYMESEGFPESYKPYLRALHAEHPNWHFMAMHTGLDWDEVIYEETHPVSISLVPNSWNDKWKSRESAAYNQETGEYIIFDSGGYVAANGYGVAYYMDPRNSLADDSVFQFLSNKFDESTQTISGIKEIVSDSYLEKRDPGSGYDTYAELIYDVGKEKGVNPLTIASMLVLEQGRSGSSDLISGTREGYEGYYNFFNIGAYASGGKSAVENGLIYAKNKGWDSPYKAIAGGAEIYANNYVYNNKSTLYFQKFNVLNGISRVGTGQYMTAIYAAASEGRILAAGYEDLEDVGITFEIPIYENMPEKPCPLPTTIDMPDVEKPEEKPSETPSETPEEKPSETPEEKPSETPEEKPADNPSVTPEDKPEEKPVPAAPSVSSSKYSIGESITGVSAGTTASALLENISVSNGTAKVLGSDGTEVSGDALTKAVGTDSKVKICDSEGKETQTSVVVIKGDNNGDGKVNSADALRAQRHSIGTLTLSGASLTASDLNGDGKVNSADALLMQRFSIGTYEIKW